MTAAVQFVTWLNPSNTWNTNSIRKRAREQIPTPGMSSARNTAHFAHVIANKNTQLLDVKSRGASGLPCQAAGLHPAFGPPHLRADQPAAGADLQLQNNGKWVARLEHQCKAVRRRDVEAPRAHGRSKAVRTPNSRLLCDRCPPCRLHTLPPAAPRQSS